MDLKSEVKIRQLRLRSTVDLANEKFNANQIDEAKSLYLEARRLSLYTGDGLKVGIMNEDADRENWNTLNEKIGTLDSAARL